MQIFGLQKLSLLDFPKKTACTVFWRLQFRCPFCQNGSLVLPGAGEPQMTEGGVLRVPKEADRHP